MGMPISKDTILPVHTSETIFVNSLEEFEQIAFDKNKTLIAFDNFKQSLYIRERYTSGEYSIVMIYFYENVAQRVQRFKREEFIEKCKKAGLKEIDIQIAEKIFIDNMKNDEVWDWVLRNNIKDVELDTIKTIKWRIKKKLFPELIKHPKKKI